MLNSPRFWKNFALFNIIFYIVLSIAAEFTGWVNDPAYISRLSEVALVLSSLSWWQAGRVEVKQYNDANVQQVLDWLRSHEDRV
jgi:hypothetical protein